MNIDILAKAIIAAAKESGMEVDVVDSGPCGCLNCRLKESTKKYIKDLNHVTDSEYEILREKADIARYAKDLRNNIRTLARTSIEGMNSVTTEAVEHDFPEMAEAADFMLQIKEKATDLITRINAAEKAYQAAHTLKPEASPESAPAA